MHHKAKNKTCQFNSVQLRRSVGYAPLYTA